MRCNGFLTLLLAAGFSGPASASCVVSIGCVVVTGAIEGCRLTSMQGKQFAEVELSGVSAVLEQCDGGGPALAGSESHEPPAWIKSQSRFHFEVGAAASCASLGKHVTLVHAPLCCDTPPQRGECAMKGERAVLRDVEP
jgi:hypothetical protein